MKKNSDPNRGTRILIIEDEAADAELLINLINQGDAALKYEFFSADTLKKGVDLLKVEGFDLVVSDVNLPDSIGTSTVTQLLVYVKDTPIILLTSNSDEGVAEAAIQLGVQDYLFKNELSATNIGRVIRFAVKRNELLNELEIERNQYRDLINAIKNGTVDSLVGTSTPSGIVQFFDSKLIEENRHQRNELEAANIELARASMFKSQFLSSMSHEIRTPLNAIQGVSDLLSESSLDEDQTQYVAMLDRANNTLLELINDILDLSKVEAGEVKLETTDFDLEVLLGHACELMAVRARQKDLDLSFQVKSEVDTRVIGDPCRLQQILVNLIGNAVKFTEQGRIVVKVENSPDSKDPLFSVSDTGIGIPQESLQTIFNSFSQVDASTTRKYGGTGLGLAISKRLTELMGGKLWVESKVGRGSTFFFEIPFEHKTMLSADKGFALDLTGKRGLIVDDSDVDRGIIADILQPLGALLVEVSSGAEAIIELRKHNSYDFVVMDCRMPKLGGIETIETLRGIGIESKTVMMLPPGHRRADLVRMRDVGVKYHVIKPIKRKHLLIAVSGALGIKDSKCERDGPVSTATSQDIRPLNILLVEDTQDNQVLIKLFLKTTPYLIDIVENGEEAIEKFVSKKYDLVLMDMQMPVMDGYTATRKIREWEAKNKKKRTPILAFTASALKEDGESTLSAGCDYHLVKPLKKVTLINTILEHTDFQNL